MGIVYMGIVTVLISFRLLLLLFAGLLLVVSLSVPLFCLWLDFVLVI